MNRRTLACLTALALTALVITGCKKAGDDAPDETPTIDTPATAPAEAGAAATSTATLEDAVVLNFTVKKMTCGGCVNAVTTGVAKLDGVKSCEVSLEEESAVVTVDDAARAQEIIATITELGFEAQQTEG